MQIESMRVISHRSWRVDEVSGAEARARLWRLEKFAELRAAGCDEALCLKVIGWSRATYHRRHKRKIGAALRRDVAGFALSDSSIGRILPGDEARAHPVSRASGRIRQTQAPALSSCCHPKTPNTTPMSNAHTAHCAKNSTANTDMN